MASGTLNMYKTTQHATVNSKLTGTFTYSTVGHVCIGCGTFTVNTAITAYETVVSDLPETVDGNPYMGVFVTDHTGYNEYYVSGKNILTREALSVGTTLRIMCVYMCK